MAGIFISYRQDDAKAWAMSLRDHLAGVFGEDQVFLDKDTLHAGNWRDQIKRALDRCTVTLVVIGPRWLTIVDEQNRPRITLPDDVHHQEVALAFSRSDVTVIPVLVDEARMPRAEQLPENLRSLSDHQAYKIGDTHARRKADLEVLVKSIREILGLKPPPEPNDPWYKFDISALGISFALTAAAMLASPQAQDEVIGSLFVVFYALVVGAKRLWRMRTDSSKRAA